MHQPSIGLNIAPAADVLGAERLESTVRPGARKRMHLMMIRFAERLAFNAIGSELERMTEQELRAAVQLYVAHL